MKAYFVFLFVTLVGSSATLTSEQLAQESTSFAADPDSLGGSAIAPGVPTGSRQADLQPRFTLQAATVGVSTLGGQFQITTNLSPHMNLRSGISVLQWKKWVTSGEFTAPGTIAMGSFNSTLDFYPFVNRGLRFSSGMLIHNSQVGTAVFSFSTPQGGPFTVNGHTYYSAPGAPNNLAGELSRGHAWTQQGVNLPRTAFTMTTGWDIRRHRMNSGPWSFPVDVGVAFLGSPTVKTVLTGGQVCDAQGLNCVGADQVPQLQSDIRAQFGSYKGHLDMLKTYPIFSFGVTYSSYGRAGRNHN